LQNCHARCFPWCPATAGQIGEVADAPPRDHHAACVEIGFDPSQKRAPAAR
jgi:hypothetical protein